MKREEVRIKKEWNGKTWSYEMPEGGRRIADETITHTSSLYGILGVEHFVIADIPKIEEEPEEEEEKPVPKKPGRPKNKEED